MILATPSGNRELRGLFGGADVVPLPSQASGAWSVAGRRVNVHDATGLPSVLSAIRLLAETIGMMPVMVYRDGLKGRERAVDDWQWRLLHDRPNDLCTPFDLFSFVMASLQGYGNAYVLKAKSRNQVQALYPLDPRRVRPVTKGDTLTFEVYAGETGGQKKELTRADVLHIPGVLLDTPYVGVSPITHHANAIGMALGAEEYAGRFYGNDATPSGALQLPFNASTQQARDMRELWEDRHRGGRNAHKVGVLLGGATYQQIGVSAQDAQMVEAQRWNVEQVARCFRVPAWSIGGTDQNPRATPEQHNQELLQFGVAPWVTRIEQAIHADDDLFPDKALFPEFLAAALLRADTATRYDAYLKGRQAGWLSVNDIRRKENEPLIDGGDEYQVTPVGGAPNLQPANGGGPPADPQAVTLNVDVRPPAVTVNVAPSEAPQVHVAALPAPNVTVTNDVAVPSVTVEAAAAPNVTVTNEIPVPAVTVEAPPAPSVTVEAPPAPSVTVTNAIPSPAPGKRTARLLRDHKGNVSGLELDD